MHFDLKPLPVMSLCTCKYHFCDISTSQYGTVSEERFSEERHMHGHVSFVDLETAKRIISESGPHFICGNEVRAKAYREKHELK
jgi:hypothetical protein